MRRLAEAILPAKTVEVLGALIDMERSRAYG